MSTVETRTLKIQDYKQLKSAMIKAYPGMPGNYWKENQIRKLLKIFPEGQMCVTVDGEVVGSALSLIIDYRHFGDDHSYREITGNFQFTSHAPKGDVLYGIEIFIRSEFRGMRLGRRLYDARKELCERLNLRAILFGGRIPHYHKYASELSPKEYIQKVKSKEIYDPTLTFQMSNDFHPKRIIQGYMPGDRESKEYAVLLQWDNVYYTKQSAKSAPPKSVVRLGLVQWQMRQYATVNELFEQVEYFVDAVSGYKSDFVLFPEFFNAPLMAKYNNLSESQAIRELAQYTPEIHKKFQELAISYNVNILTGSMPLLRKSILYNVGYLCRRNGTSDYYEKLHITPDEVKFWGIQGGNKLSVFDTDCGKIGVLICYDVEFPETARLLAEQGMKILFVPYLTDTQNGYSRVRYCAHARAIENECYVAIAGSVGNLPKVQNMDMQFSQALVYTPSDFSFPSNGIKAEATANAEMILVADVDLDLLAELHSYGSVRNLRDRRTDLFQIHFTKSQKARTKKAP